MPRFVVAAILLAVVVMLASYRLIHSNYVTVDSRKNAGFAVVELFTSEGCSSCPPADAAVANLLNSDNRNIYVLGFHVDYWNSLGWKDVYSDAVYSTRQQGYSSILKLNSIYTPQAIVNGTTEFVGSDTKRLHEAVENALAGTVEEAIEIKAKATSSTEVNVAYTLSKAGQRSTINIALVQLHAQSNVQKGENSGKVLSHVNVVRSFKTINYNQTNGTVSLQVPEGLHASDCKIIAFVQKADGQITVATEVGIE